MGGGAWSTTSYATSVTSKGFATVDAMAYANVQDVYESRKLDPVLNPYKVIRECCDSEEHPETLPIILALDVTGSMGAAATATAAELDDIMTELYKSAKDVEFMTMGIGDLSYDDAPIQVTQFESDVRIFDQTTKIYFEGGGGGNYFESYTAAWYFGLYNTKLDCWKRGKKGIIITMGDEPLNPYLPGHKLSDVLGIKTQDVDTEDLYKAVCEKFDVYHIAIDDNRNCYRRYKKDVDKTWGDLLGQHYMISTLDNLPQTIAAIVEDHMGYMPSDVGSVTVTEEGISW